MNTTLLHSQSDPAESSGTPYRHLRKFTCAILGVGAVRFGLTLAGTPDSIVRWASMTAVIVAALFYFASRSTDWKQRLVISYVLIAPYMLVEILGIGYQWTTGRPTIFHAEPYTLGSPIEAHFWGHVVGAVTWEPWAIFVLMTVLNKFARGFRPSGDSDGGSRGQRMC